MSTRLLNKSEPKPEYIPPTLETLPTEVRHQIFLELFFSCLEDGLSAAERKDSSLHDSYHYYPVPQGTRLICTDNLNSLSLVNKSFYASINFVVYIVRKKFVYDGRNNLIAAKRFEDGYNTLRFPDPRVFTLMMKWLEEQWRMSQKRSSYLYCEELMISMSAIRSLDELLRRMEGGRAGEEDDGQKIGEHALL